MLYEHFDAAAVAGSGTGGALSACQLTATCRASRPVPILAVTTAKAFPRRNAREPDQPLQCDRCA